MRKNIWKRVTGLLCAVAMLAAAVPVYAEDSAEASVPEAKFATEEPEGDYEATDENPASWSDQSEEEIASAAQADPTDPINIVVKYQQTSARNMLSLINQFRTSGSAWFWNSDNKTKTTNYKAAALQYDYGLEQIAMQRAAEIACSFSHTRPDNTSCFTAKDSKNHSSHAENIAVTYSSSESNAFNLFKEENQNYSNQGHRRIMLSSGYKAVGIAHVYAGGYHFWVQEFRTSATGVAQTAANNSQAAVKVNVSANRLNEKTLFLSTDDFVLMQGKTHATPSAILRLRFKDCFPSGQYVLVGNLPMKWTIKDTSLATVSGSSATGLKPGKTQITGTVQGNAFGTSKTISLTVVSDKSIPMYRLYNPNSGEHFYTKDVSERNAVVKAGWRLEGVGWYAPQKSNTPVYRLYNPNAGDHHYTLSAQEVNNLVKAGWKYEGIRWYSDDYKRVPLYRQYNPNAKAGAHNYTTSKKENDYLVKVGWRAEGICWYGM